MSEYLHQKQWGVRVGIQQKMSLLVVFFYEEASSTPPPPLVIPRVIKILGPYFNVAVDVIGPKTNYTLKTNRKKLKKNYWKLKTLTWFIKKSSSSFTSPPKRPQVVKDNWKGHFFGPPPSEDFCVVCNGALFTNQWSKGNLENVKRGATIWNR